MPNLMWSWQQAVAVAGVLAVVWGVLKVRDAAPRVRGKRGSAGIQPA